jgi:hypothetical protein
VTDDDVWNQVHPVVADEIIRLRDVCQRQQDEIERLNDLVARLNDDLSYYRTVISDWVDADDAREGHTADCYEYGTCGVQMCAQENHLRLAVMR